MSSSLLKNQMNSSAVLLPVKIMKLVDGDSHQQPAT